MSKKNQGNIKYYINPVISLAVFNAFLNFLSKFYINNTRHAS